jgi:hypothetical protein
MNYRCSLGNARTLGLHSLARSRRLSFQRALNQRDERPGPPGRSRLIEDRARQRIASPIRKSPWLSNRMECGLGSASISMRIVKLHQNSRRWSPDNRRGLRTACTSYDCQDSRAQNCLAISFTGLDDILGPRRTPSSAKNAGRAPLTAGASPDPHWPTIRRASKRASTSWTTAPRMLLISKSLGV